LNWPWLILAGFPALLAAGCSRLDVLHVALIAFMAYLRLVVANKVEDRT